MGFGCLVQLRVMMIVKVLLTCSLKNTEGYIYSIPYDRYKIQDILLQARSQSLHCNLQNKIQFTTMSTSLK